MTDASKTSFNVASKAGWMYFAVHFITELLCFFMMSRVIGDPVFLGTAAVLYNALAFVPQLMIGSFRDLVPGFKPGIIGVIMLVSGFVMFFLADDKGILFWTSLVLLCIGNALIHVSGAELTIRSSGGRLSPVAIFVSGGSFGLITGRVLAMTELSFWWIAAAGVLMLPMIIYAETFYRDVPDRNMECLGYNHTSPKRVIGVVIAAAFFIVTIRSFIGYGIPTSWNKTLIQTVLLYVFMGTGKAMGGILSDRIGIRKTSFISIIGAVPFLVFGDRIMIVSLIGVMFFSMTMAVTLGMLVSVMKIAPGAAFGVTTVGLFTGTILALILKTDSLLINCFMIVISSAVCFLLASFVLKPSEKQMV
ncbi:MAG: hypothetical protein J5685_12230 [Clostridiales bacterium]|nr:hypothetical protein [Clostridiales bacterium]